MIDLDAIKERCRAASGEPWEPAIWTDEGTPYEVWGVQQIHRDAIGNNIVQGWIVHGVYRKEAEFIAHARADIPALVAEIERLQRELHDEQVRRREWEKMYNQAIKTEEETGDDTQIMLQAPRRGVWRTAERTAVGGCFVDHRQ